MAFSNFRLSSYLPIFAGMFLVFGVALTVIVLQNQQEERTRASTETTMLAAGTTCTNGPADIMLIIDKSGSMANKAGSTTKISAAKTAAKTFVDIVSKNTNTRVGLVSFSTTATLDSGFTTDYSSVKSKIDAIKVVSHTCTQCGAQTTFNEIKSHGRAGVKQIVVLLTDGKANWIPGSTSEIYGAHSENPVYTVVNASHAAPYNTIYYTIGLGNSSDINPTFLNNIATSTGGHYYYTATTDQLNTIFTQISNTQGTGSISGFVFEDTNGNGAFDSDEKKLPGWTLQLFVDSATTPQTTTVSDKDGNYVFQGLCSGIYKVKEVLQTGWTQTLPPSADGYTNISISNGVPVTDKNFGNKPGPVNGNIKLSFDLLLHGIGKAGDSPNPGPAGGGNPDPNHKNRTITVDVYDSANHLTTKTGNVTYASDSGSFKTNPGQEVDMGVLPTGNYIVKVKFTQSLKTQVGNLQNLPTGTTSALPQISLVTGDINNDNKILLNSSQLDILDYNILLNCFSTYLPAKSCNSSQKDQADLDDNGKVDQFDFNLFVREISHVTN